jgi:hypothetical protein
MGAVPIMRKLRPYRVNSWREMPFAPGGFTPSICLIWEPFSVPGPMP